MSKPLDELYFVWLYRQVADPEVQAPSRTFWALFRLLFTTEFIWIIPNDDNRIEDGKDLRYEFIEQEGVVNVEVSWMRLGCSMFEMLIGLSRRLAFEAEGEPRDWFWVLMGNLGLSDYNDTRSLVRVPAILERVIWRTYNYDGDGGLFPLNNPPVDQRRTEIWYQLNAYLLQNS